MRFIFRVNDVWKSKQCNDVSSCIFPYISLDSSHRTVSGDDVEHRVFHFRNKMMPKTCLFDFLVFQILHVLNHGQEGGRPGDMFPRGFRTS